jgi:hypothetical protein
MPPKQGSVTAIAGRLGIAAGGQRTGTAWRSADPSSHGEIPRNSAQPTEVRLRAPIDNGLVVYARLQLVEHALADASPPADRGDSDVLRSLPTRSRHSQVSAHFVWSATRPRSRFRVPNTQEPGQPPGAQQCENMPGAPRTLRRTMRSVRVRAHWLTRDKKAAGRRALSSLCAGR